MRPIRPAAYIIHGPYGDRVTLSCEVARRAEGGGSKVEPLYRSSVVPGKISQTETEVAIARIAASQGEATREVIT